MRTLAFALPDLHRARVEAALGLEIAGGVLLVVAGGLLLALGGARGRSG